MCFTDLYSSTWCHWCVHMQTITSGTSEQSLPMPQWLKYSFVISKNNFNIKDCAVCQDANLCWSHTQSFQWCVSTRWRKSRTVTTKCNTHSQANTVRWEWKKKHWTSATQSGPPSSSINWSRVLGGSRSPRRSTASSRSRFKALAFSTALMPGTDCCGLPTNILHSVANVHTEVFNQWMNQSIKIIWQGNLTKHSSDVQDKTYIPSEWSACE